MKIIAFTSLLLLLTCLACQEEETVVLTTVLSDGTEVEREVKRSVLEREHELEMRKFSHIIVLVNADGSLREAGGEIISKEKLFELLSAKSKRSKSLTIVADPKVSGQEIVELHELAELYKIARVHWIHKDSFVEQAGARNGE